MHYINTYPTMCFNFLQYILYNTGILFKIKFLNIFLKSKTILSPTILRVLTKESLWEKLESTSGPLPATTQLHGFSANVLKFFLYTHPTMYSVHGTVHCTLTLEISSKSVYDATKENSPAILNYLRFYITFLTEIFSKFDLYIQYTEQNIL